MANTYTKLFQKILDSTVWMESDQTRLVWITLLAMCDQDGLIDAPVPAIASRAKVSVEDCQKAVNIFLAPDPHSRTKAFEGRRIEINESGGIVLLNHKKYRDMMSLEARRDYRRLKAREYRREAAEATRGMTLRQRIYMNNKKPPMRLGDIDEDTEPTAK